MSLTLLPRISMILTMWIKLCRDFLRQQSSGSKSTRCPTANPQTSLPSTESPRTKSSPRRSSLEPMKAGKLISGASASGGLNTNNTTLNNGATLDQDAANAILSQLPEKGEDESLPEDVHKWHYVSLK